MDRDVPALLAFLASRATMPHAWGSKANDCASFADGAVRAQTGSSALAGLKWADEKSARRVLAKLGGMEAALDARFERIAPAFAMRGDIAGVIAEDGSGIHPMIVEGPMLCSPGTRGLKRRPRADMVIAWSVVRRRHV